MLACMKAFSSMSKWFSFAIVPLTLQKILKVNGFSIRSSNQPEASDIIVFMPPHCLLEETYMKHKEILESYRRLDGHFASQSNQRYINGERLMRISNLQIKQWLKYGELPSEFLEIRPSSLQAAATSYLIIQYPEIKQIYDRLDLASMNGLCAAKQGYLAAQSDIQASDILEDIDCLKERLRQSNEQNKQLIQELEKELEQVIGINEDIANKLRWNRAQRTHYANFTQGYKRLISRMEGIIGSMGPMQDS